MYQFSIGQESIENEAYHKKKKKKVVLNSEMTLLGLNRFILSKFVVAFCYPAYVSREVNGS